jgi:hypothetical protein
VRGHSIEADLADLAVRSDFADTAEPADACPRAGRDVPCLRWTFRLLGDALGGFFT